MLKLFKYEWIHSYRSYGILFITYLLLCLVVPFLVQMPVDFKDFFIVAFVFLSFAIGCIVLQNIFTLFSNSMFKKGGYLTQTLPFSSYEILFIKILSTLIWFIFAIIVLLVGVAVFAFVTYSVERGFNSVLPAFIHLFRQLPNTLLFIFKEPLFYSVLFYGLSNLTLLVLLSFFSMIAVNTRYVTKYKKLTAVIIFIVINMLTGFISRQVFSNHYTSIIDASLYLPALYSMPMNPSAFIPTIYSLGIYNLVISVILYLASVYVLENFLEI